MSNEPGLAWEARLPQCAIQYGTDGVRLQNLAIMLDTFGHSLLQLETGELNFDDCQVSFL